MMEDLEKWGKEFTSMQESLDTSNAVGRFVVDIIQRIAQLESEQIGERTKMGMVQKAETGEGIMGFNPPFGYKIEFGKLEPVPNEADTVKEVFSGYDAGECMKDLAWRLNKEERFTRRGNMWTVWSISHLLHNPIYAGWREWDEIRVPGDHLPIISVELFNKVQSRIAENVKNPKNKRIIELPLDVTIRATS